MARRNDDTETPPGLIVTPFAMAPESASALEAWLEQDGSIPWEQAIEGRRVAQFGSCVYSYERQCVDMRATVPIPNQLREWLPAAAALDYSQCIINVYEASDGIPFHTDDAVFGENVLVFCIGESRQLQLRRVAPIATPNTMDFNDAPAIFSVMIDHLSSYCLSGDARYKWEHAVGPGSGRRVSITFRSVVSHGSEMWTRRLLATDGEKRCSLEAIGAMERACCKHSGYRVGACLLTATGKCYSGVNVESDTYGLTCCAERVALFKALSENERDFTFLACATVDGGISCGACRQLLAEYCPEDMACVFLKPTGEVVRRVSVKAMMPDPFVLSKL